MAGLSKYFIAVFVIFYTFHCFAVFTFRDDEERSIFYIFQNVLMVMTHLLGFYVLYVRTGDSTLLLLCVLEELLLFALLILFRMIYPLASRLITNNICMLLAVSFVMLARLSYTRAWKQFAIAAVGAGIAVAIPYFMRKLEMIRYYYWWAGIGGLIILLAMMTIGTVTNGSKISLTIFGVTFLPSEFVRLMYIFFIAGMLTDPEHRNRETGRIELPQLLSCSIISAAHIGILAMCKDLGSALLFFVVFVFMLYTATRAPVVLVCGFGGMAAASLAGYRLFAHVRNRVRAWRDPFADIEGSGYQVAQSLFAIGTGSWFGMGLMGGSPKAIPAVAKDFIFAAISEEMGALTALCIILISLSNFLMFMNISMSIRDIFLRLMAVGLAVNYGFQVILTIGGVTKFIPLTGITLPLVSYGGSSVIVTFIYFSLIQGLYVMERSDQEDEDVYDDPGSRNGRYDYDYDDDESYDDYDEEGYESD